MGCFGNLIIVFGSILCIVLYGIVEWFSLIYGYKYGYSNHIKSSCTVCVIFLSLYSWTNNVYLKAFVGTTVSIHYSWRGVKSLINTWWISWVLPIMAKKITGLPNFKVGHKWRWQPNCYNAKMEKERKKIVKIVVLTKQNIWTVKCILWDLNYWNVDTKWMGLKIKL